MKKMMAALLIPALARDCGTVSGDAYKEEFVYLLTLPERTDQSGLPLTFPASRTPL